MASVVQVVKSFLDQHHDGLTPFLLALSGGPDSLALFHCLTQMKLPFAVAHVNHRWRKESDQETEILKKLVEEAGVPFHLLVLDPQSIHGNLESACRQLRHTFFKDLCQTYGYLAVLLGHHKDDHMETLIKQFLEGTSLLSMHGIKAVKLIEEITLWRPLLEVTKKDILEYIAYHQLQPFDDETNNDPSFLRARMRNQILPYLNEWFGKEITAPVTRKGEEARELNHYLEQNVQHDLEKISSGPFGSFLEVPFDKHTYEVKHLIRKLCERERFSLPYNLVDKGSKLLLSGVSNKKIVVKEGSLHIDRGRLFATRGINPLKAETIPLTCGTHQFGGFQIVVDEEHSDNKTGWQQAWGGELSVHLPVGSYHLSSPDKDYQRLNKLWTNDKVPAFLRHSYPVICYKDKTVHEFLSGRFPELPSNQQGISITIKRSCP